jgi:hypothetical protein
LKFKKFKFESLLTQQTVWLYAGFPRNITRTEMSERISAIKSCFFESDYDEMSDGDGC